MCSLYILYVSYLVIIICIGVVKLSKKYSTCLIACLFMFIFAFNSSANNDYTNIPLDMCYTENGFIWYKQSSYIQDGAIGFWEGNASSYRGSVVNMPNPTGSGCGPISFAIIASNVRQELITPKQTIQYYCDTGLYTGNGSSHSCGVKSAQHWGLSYDLPSNVIHSDRTLDRDVEVAWMVDHLKKGHWIQILVKGTPNVRNTIWPNNGGHFVAIHGYKDGKTYVYDSSREERLEELFDIVEVWENIRSPHADNCAYRYHMTAIW